MRIKSNYGTIDPYLVAQISSSDHATFNRALCTTARATVGLLELYILRRIGTADYGQIVADFIRQDTAASPRRRFRPVGRVRRHRVVPTPRRAACGNAGLGGDAVARGAGAERLLRPLGRRQLRT